MNNIQNQTKTIVLLGDSMIDTYDFMESGFPELRSKLKNIDSEINYVLKNHGVGGTDVSLGLERISKPYNYVARQRKLQSVLEEKPDLVVVESFAYNHWTASEEDLGKYIETHQKIIESLIDKTKIILMTTICPNRNTFAQGVIGLGWNQQRQLDEYQLVIKYLELFSNFAKNSGLPFLDLFASSINDHGTGETRYISNVDFIHLSYAGRVFISNHLAPLIVKSFD